MPGLLDPIDIAGLHLRNRIVMPPMASGRAGPDGHATADHVEYHRLRAAAGTALVIVEHSYVLPVGRFNEGQLGVHEDGCVPGLAKVAAAIRSAGAVACLQLAHAGATGMPAIPGRRPVAPSAVPHPYGKGDVPAEVSRDDLAETVRAFGDAAARAVAAGFDMVEVHAAHGFLLCQFLSPLTNRRGDRYGGSEENRGRLHCEVLAEVRRRVGPKTAIAMRLGADDETPGEQQRWRDQPPHVAPSPERGDTAVHEPASPGDHRQKATEHEHDTDLFAHANSSLTPTTRSRRGPAPRP